MPRSPGSPPLPAGSPRKDLRCRGCRKPGPLAAHKISSGGSGGLGWPRNQEWHQRPHVIVILLLHPKEWGELHHLQQRPWSYPSNQVPLPLCKKPHFHSPP